MTLHVDDTEQFLADYDNREELGWTELQARYGDASRGAYSAKASRIRRGIESPFAYPTAQEDEDDEGDVSDLLAKAAKSQQRAADGVRVARASTRAMARSQVGYDDLIEAVRDEFALNPPPKVQVPRPHINGSKPVLTPVLLLSDLHTGPIYKRGRMQGLTEFNDAVFAQRIYRLCEAVLEITESLRSMHTVNRLILAFGGDNIEGRLIFPGQANHTKGLVRQFRLFSEIIAVGLIEPLAATFERIDERDVPGNHGRSGHKEDGLDSVEDSLDVLAMDMLKLRCAHLSNVHWDRTDGDFKLFQLHGWNFLLHHGDNASGGETHTPTTRARSFKRNFESVAHQKIDVTLSGHLHSAGLAMDNFSTNITNGSIPGAGPYGVKLGYNTPPVQTLVTVSDKYPIHGHYPIWLATRNECITLEPENLDVLA